MFGLVGIFMLAVVAGVFVVESPSSQPHPEEPQSQEVAK